MLRHILVAVDFSDASERALQVAGALARRTGARVTALHAEVFDAPAYFTREQIRQLEDDRERLQAAAAQHLRKVAARAGVPEVTAIVVDAAPAEAVLAREGDADLLVMGTHGRSGLGRWWLGSVTERVLRETRVPLLVVRPEPEGSPADDVFARVLVLAAGDRTTAEIWATDVAQRFGGRVTLTALPDAAAAGTVRCTPHELAEASLVVASLGAHGDERLGHAAVRLLRDCPRPMLFV